MKRVFLTGATGLVGSKLTELLSNHCNVIALSRNKHFSSKHLKWIVYDISKSDMLLCKIMENCEVVIHNAGSTNEPRNEQEKKEIEKINLIFTENILKCAPKIGFKKIIFTSGLNILKKPLPLSITETSKLKPITQYAITKYYSEKLVEEHANKYNLSYNILRLSSPVDNDFENMPNTVIKKWIAQSINKQIIQVFGSGNRTQDFVATTDIANAFLSCVEKKVSNGIYNIASGNSISMLHVAQLITKKFGNSFEFVGTDINEDDRWNISIEKAKKELNYNPNYTSTTILQQLLNKLS